MAKSFMAVIFSIREKRSLFDSIQLALQVKWSSISLATFFLKASSCVFFSLNFDFIFSMECGKLLYKY